MTQEHDSTQQATAIPDPEAMDQTTYHHIVGPAMKSAADTAAKRGHKHLFDDMPAMLSLIDMVNHLSHLYRQHYPDRVESQQTLIDNAAAAACVMVFQEVSLPAESIEQCLGALEAAYKQLQDQSVIADNTSYIAMAWSHLDEGDRQQAEQCLGQACEWTIAAIETWREQQY